MWLFQGGAVEKVTLLTKTTRLSVSDNDKLLQDKLKSDDFEETFYVRLQDVPVTEGEEIALPDSVRVDELMVILESPVDKSATYFNDVKVGVHACFEPVGK